MRDLCRKGLLIFILMLGACALPGQNPYDEWRSFYLRVATMNTVERNAEFLKLRGQHEQSPGSMTGLQLAYLTLLLPAPDAESYSGVNTAALLEGISDDHKLAPVRDLLSQSLQLRGNYASKTEELKELRKECEVVTNSRQNLLRKRKALQDELAICADQVEALKEIESVMSAPEPDPAMNR